MKNSGSSILILIVPILMMARFCMNSTKVAKTSSHFIDARHVAKTTKGFKNAKTKGIKPKNAIKAVSHSKTALDIMQLDSIRKKNVKKQKIRKQGKL